MSPPACQPNSSSSTNQRAGAHITIEFENRKSAHPTTLQHILEKAEHLLNKNRAVMKHPVPGWNAYKICSHSLAVAEKSGRTVDYLKWLRTKGPQQMNLTSLITSDSNKGVGKKACKTSTARRKGGRNTNKAPPTNVVDRVTCVSTL